MSCVQRFVISAQRAVRDGMMLKWIDARRNVEVVQIVVEALSVRRKAIFWVGAKYTI